MDSSINKETVGAISDKPIVSSNPIINKTDEIITDDLLLTNISLEKDTILLLFSFFD